MPIRVAALWLMLFATAAAAEPAKTSKERLSDKAADEQRVDNCKVPPERRGPVVRPDCADKAQAPERLAPPTSPVGEPTGEGGLELGPGPDDVANLFNAFLRRPFGPSTDGAREKPFFGVTVHRPDQVSSVGVSGIPFDRLVVMSFSTKGLPAAIMLTCFCCVKCSSGFKAASNRRSTTPVSVSGREI